ncbi:MAG: hypothetical protein A3K60_03770 [Euryarchaeota archaeon RBG_19FT_COMBO_56_21]|nr:MAG: hypothetical protein A3K60_03770 [Euryarchaeota archaeon RBG_19FT_COMBO_56_21]
MLVALFIALAMLVPVAGITGFVGDAVAPPTETVLRIGYTQNVDSLNPFLGLSDASYFLYSLVYDHLQSIGNDMEVVSNLAVESRIVDVAGCPYGSVWEYDITPNAQWHDGTPLTVEDIEWNINLNCMGANYTDMWAYQPYMYFAKYAVVMDSDTVRVTFFERETGELIPCAYANMLGLPMLPKHLLGGYSTSYVSFMWPGYFTDEPTRIVGTGPFMGTSNIVDEYAVGNQITLVRNPNYHWLTDKGQQIHFDKLIMYFYDDDTAMKIALASNLLDVAQFPSNTFRSIEDDIAAGTLLNVDTYSGLKPTQYWTEIAFNMHTAGPNMWRLDPLARHALAQAVNKTYIVNNFYKGFAEEGVGLISPVTPYWHWEPTPSEYWSYDLIAAAVALESAGYRDMDADGRRECTLDSAAVQNGWSLEGAELDLNMMVRMEYPEEKEIAKYLQEQWALIGVDLTYYIMLEDVLAKNAYSYSYDSMIWYWSSDPDPNYMLFCQSEKAINGWSDNMYSNPEYEENYANSVKALDSAERQQYVRSCQKINYQDAAYIIMAYVYSTYAWRTDTFINWGDWGADPGRSPDAYWTGNPLLFDLIPNTGDNWPPAQISLDVLPSVARPGDDVLFTVGVVDWNGDAIEVMVEFGDGTFGLSTTLGGSYDFQYTELHHAYAANGHYDVRVWANDSYGPDTHNYTVISADRVIVNSVGYLNASIIPSTVTIPEGESTSLSCELIDPDDPGENPIATGYFWVTTIGSLNPSNQQDTLYTAPGSVGSGTIMCLLDFYEDSYPATADVTVEPAPLSSVTVTPGFAYIIPGNATAFWAEAYDTLGALVSGATFSWTVGGMSASDFTLNSTVGSSVLFSPLVEGTAWLNATTTVGNATGCGSATVLSTYSLPSRSIDYRWYDMFAVPNGDWWDYRWDVTNLDEPLTDSYPYLYRWYGREEGNTWIYSSMRLNVTARNVWEVNTTSWPQFLPMMGTHRGGNIAVDWYMQYMVPSDFPRYPLFIPSQYDGWLAILNGTVTLDRDAAMMVLGISSAQFDDFATWWSSNAGAFRLGYTDWLNYEGKVRLDIYNTYWYPFTLMYFDLDAQKLGSQIVLTYDMVSWGMDALMASWLCEAFMPGEWYYEDFNLHATIDPESASLDVDTAVEYAVCAYVTTLEGTPCWRWEPLVGDSMASSPSHPDSDFDPYVGTQYVSWSPGSELFGTYIDYDHTPSAFNLSTNERLTFEWPAGDQLFLLHGGPVWNTTHLVSEMDVRYCEPGASDMPAGQFSADGTARSLELVGPFDMWTWSKTQTAHEFLQDEWLHVGALPYGIPMIEFTMGSNGPIPYYMTIEGVANPIDLNTADDFSVKVWDQYHNPYPFYNGTVGFYSNDTAAVLPADFTFSNSGSENFSVVFNTMGYHNLTVVDVDNASLNGHVNLMVGPIATLMAFEDIPMNAMSRIPFSMRVTVYDQFGNVFSNYTGQVHFTTTDAGGSVMIPADYTFVVGDAGTHLFDDGFVLETIGMQDIVVVDMADAVLTDTMTLEVVSAFPASKDFKVYDMFEESWGWWWPLRWSFYITDIVITDDPHMNTMLFMPGKTDQYQCMMYAPYRYSVNAVNQSLLNVDTPVMMPTFGPVVSGASVDMEIYFQYLDPTWWESYWIPNWVNLPGGIDNTWLYRSGADGYDLGTVYTVEMNREAALQWLGMPQTALASTWWAANNASYTASWESWIKNQGNTVYDIFCGYEWTYDINGGTWMNLVENGATGNVTLTIAHIALGFEILMTRWMTAANLSPLEAYYEDFSLHTSYSKYVANVSTDCVVQYSLHAVKANQTVDDPAWVWEPALIDYITKIGHPSKYKPYSTRTYQSWNAGDTFLGQEIAYEQTPAWFNLTAGDKLVIQLPTGTVPGYRGVALTPTDIDNAAAGDLSGIHYIMENGTMALGYFVTGWPPETGIDLEPLYDVKKKVLTIAGPQSFNNKWHTATGILYHSAPWIEFNVITTQPYRPPVADAGPDQGVLPDTEVWFDGSGSYDDGPTLNYTWSFTYNSVPVTLYGESPSFVFVTEGLYDVMLTVRDSGGQTTNDTMTLTVSALIPEFPALVMPVLAGVLIAVIMMRRRRR